MVRSTAVRRTLAAAAVAIAAAASAGAAPGAPPPGPNRFTVAFATHIVSGSAAALPIVFDASYAAPGGAARFRIALTEQIVTFRPVPGSNSQPLLVALQHALGARRFPTHRARAAQLQVASVVLGYKAATGWVNTKLLFGNNGEGELYLNLNLKKGIGQFSLVDARYGNYVLAQLARVL